MWQIQVLLWEVSGIFFQIFSSQWAGICYFGTYGYGGPTVLGFDLIIWVDDAAFYKWEQIPKKITLPAQFSPGLPLPVLNH